MCTGAARVWHGIVSGQRDETREHNACEWRAPLPGNLSIGFGSFLAVDETVILLTLSLHHY